MQVYAIFVKAGDNWNFLRSKNTQEAAKRQLVNLQGKYPDSVFRLDSMTVR